MDYDDEEGPGPQLSVELLSSIWTTQNYDSEASSHGEDIPADFTSGKRKRQDTELLLHESSSPRLGNNSSTLRFESVKLKRPQQANRMPTEPARNNQGRKDIYVIPGTPKAPQRFQRNLRRNTVSKSMNGNNLEDSELDNVDDTKPNLPHTSDDEEGPVNEEDAKDEAEDESESKQDDEEYNENKGRKRVEEFAPNPSAPRRSSRLMAKTVVMRRSLRVPPTLRKSIQGFNAPEQAGRRRPLTRLVRGGKFERVEVAASSYISSPPRGEDAESEIAEASEASSTGKDTMARDAQSAENRSLMSASEEPANDVNEEAYVDGQREHWTDINNESDHEIQLRHESEKDKSDLEAQSEHEGLFGASESENESQMEWESRETDLKNVTLQDPDATDFWSATTLFGQHTNWSDLLAEAKRLIPGPSLTQKNPLLCKLLAAIAQAKQLYAKTSEIRQNYQTVPDHLDEAEKSNTQQVVEQVSHILSRVRLVFDEKGDLDANDRDLERKRQAVHEIIGYAVPELVDLLKPCVTAHYIDHELSIGGMKQLTQLLQSLSLLCEKIQPKFFRPYIHFGDMLKNTRVVVRFLWTVFDNESNRIQAKQRLEKFNSIQQKRSGPRQNMQNRRQRRQEATPAATDEEQDEHISIVSIDDESSTDQLSESPEEFPWTTAESEALVAGLERYQGLNRYTMILRDFKTELSGRTMEDLRLKAREIRDSYVAAMRLDNLMLDAQQWSWLLEV
ncbi:hypothetical protein EMCG_02336 [[Emmonsia] crescens]|uniref:Myb-like domain-containing protein n=1 Tax=[Emmonsia] crescens TaxID=73230 RepID=A0A0G2HZQ9_9EURO|nr:hypothetical protein EMCG_02336 [Emmonsia crescens UAMH 3008]